MAKYTMDFNDLNEKLAMLAVKSYVEWYAMQGIAVDIESYEYYQFADFYKVRINYNLESEVQ